MSKPFYFGTNFKMYQTATESRQFVERLIATPELSEKVQLFLIPPYTSLSGLSQLARTKEIWIGAQNMHHAIDGEYTGEISPPMLNDLNVDLVLLGHAERRKHFGETDQRLNKKIHAGIAHQLRLLLCVGETEEHRYYGIEREIVTTQLKICLHNVAPSVADSLIIAYEPVWSIGQDGQPATPIQVKPIIEQICITLNDLFGTAAQKIPILYGGSINAENCRDYAQCDWLDGLFVGRAVRQVDHFINILQTSYQARMRG